jgi:tetratricopeptide (TPR) repeat protein
MDKRARLRSLLQEDPNDPFLLFALAKEWEKHDSQKAIEYYLQLKSAAPEYLALYYHLGQLYHDLDLNEQAKDMLKAGLKIAKQQKDKKTEGELQQLLLNVELAG